MNSPLFLYPYLIAELGSQEAEYYNSSMQLFQRLLILFFGLFLSLTAWATPVFFDHEDVTYMLDDGQVYVHGCATGHFSGDVTIPNLVTYKGVTYYVTQIYVGAFSNSNELTSLILPETITKIGHTAFANCTALRVLQINATNPPIVNLDEDGGFASIKNTCKLIVPTTSIELYLNATGWNEFVNVAPLQPKYDATNCFNGVINNYRIFGQFYSPIINKQFPLYLSNSNRNLNVGIGGGVAFDNVECRAILGLDIISDTPIQSYPRSTPSAEFMDITLPALSWDGIYALMFFRSDIVVGVCYVTDRGKLVDDLLYYTYNTFNNEATIIKYGGTYSTRPASLAIPETVQLSNDNVKKSFKVSRIFDEALINYNTLESIVIPKTVNYVGPNAFKGCTSLSDITLTDGDKAIDFSSSISNSGDVLPALKDCPVEKVYMGRNVYSSTFKSQSKLKSAIIGDSVTYLASLIFSNCASLTDLTMGESIKSIGEYAFKGCSSLEKIVLPTGLREIGQGAFENCKSLNGLILPETITELGTNSNGPVNPNYIFSGCDSLNAVICLYSPSIGKPLVPASTKIYNPDASKYGWGESMLTIPFTKLEYSGNSPSIPFINHCESEIVTLYNISWKYLDFTVSENTRNQVDNDIAVGTYRGASKIGMSYNGGTFQYEIPCEIEIIQAPLIISAPDITRVYGKPNPSIELEYNGFVNGETESVLTKFPAITISASEDSDVGVYTIELSGAEARNYDISYISGTLTITKANQEIKWIESYDDVTVGDEIELAATTTSGLPVEYTSSDSDIAEIADNIVKFLREGEVTITAVQAGNENYEAAEAVSRSFAVNRRPEDDNLTLNTSEASMKPEETLQLLIEDYEWASSDEKIATVSETGLVTAIADGEVVITLSRRSDGATLATCKIKVDFVSSTSELSIKKGIEIDCNGNEVRIKGASASSTAWIYDMNGHTVYSGLNRTIHLESGTYIVSIQGSRLKVIIK